MASTMNILVTNSPAFISLLFMVKEIRSCVVFPNETVTTVGEKVSFSCNARSQGEAEDIITNFKLGSEGPTGKLIFQPPAYGSNGKISRKVIVSDDYFLYYLKEDLSEFTIQINETQLKHGGEYFCRCTGVTSSVGFGNLLVFEQRPSFVQNKDIPLESGASLELNCSISFSGSFPFASIDLTILNANGTQLSNRSNLPLIKNVTGYHVTYNVIADQNKEQNFACELNVWNKSSLEKNLLHSGTSSLIVNWGHTATSTQKTTKESTTNVVSVIVGVILVTGLTILLIVLVRRNCHRNETSEQPVRLTDVDLVVADNDMYSYSKEIDPTEPSEQPMKQTAVDLMVVENDIYSSSQKIDPTDGYKTEPIYCEVIKSDR